MNSGWQQECGFHDVWSSDDYIKIFIASNNIGQTTNIYKVELSMEYDQTGTILKVRLLLCVSDQLISEFVYTICKTF